MPIPASIITDEEAEPLALPAKNVPLGRKLQKQRNESRQRRLQAAKLAQNNQLLQLWAIVKRNVFLALLFMSVLFNVIFLWEKGLMKGNGDEASVVAKKHSIFPNSQFGVCQKLPFDSPQLIWAEYLGRIFQASRLPSDHEDTLHDLRASMLAMVSPKLPLAVKTLDKDWNTVAATMEKGWKRWEYVNSRNRENLEEPPMVRIVVMGGSVTFGHGCKSGVKFHEHKLCSWPYRLNVMLNQLVGDVFLVSNVAVGGTNTAVGTKILQYDTLAEETDQADIIINAYSMNDNLEEEEDIFQMIQSFCRQVFTPHPCKFLSKPLLIYLNDALGDDKKPLMDSTWLPGVIEVLSNYYGFGSISYVDVVKQWVTGDSMETWFSPDTYWGDDHPGQGMHITTSWIVAYYLLSVVTNFCSLEPWDILGKPMSSLEISYVPELLPPGLPDIRNASNVILKGKPRSPPQDIMPPRLDATMTMHDVSQQWAKSKLEKGKCKDHAPGWKQCPFSWVSDHGAIGGDWLRKNILDKTVENSDWVLEPPHITKPGFRTPDHAKVGSHMTIEFDGQPHPINRVVVFTHRGHGEKWENSMASIEILAANGGEWKARGSKNVPGYQNRTHSKMEVQDIGLEKEIATGNKLRVRITLTNGQAFKLMGLALCIS